MPIDPFENFLFYLQLDFLEQMKFVSVRAEKETKEKYSSLFSVKKMPTRVEVCDIILQECNTLRIFIKQRNIKILAIMSFKIF